MTRAPVTPLHATRRTRVTSSLTGASSRVVEPPFCVDNLKLAVNVDTLNDVSLRYDRGKSDKMHDDALRRRKSIVKQIANRLAKGNK